MEATAILEYFAPLYDWLVKTNRENGVEIGWDLSYGKIMTQLSFLIVSTLSSSIYRVSGFITRKESLILHQFYCPAEFETFLEDKNIMNE